MYNNETTQISLSIQCIALVLENPCVYLYVVTNSTIAGDGVSVVREHVRTRCNLKTNF